MLAIASLQLGPCRFSPFAAGRRPKIALGIVGQRATSRPPTPGHRDSFLAGTTCPIEESASEGNRRGSIVGGRKNADACRRVGSPAVLRRPPVIGPGEVPDPLSRACGEGHGRARWLSTTPTTYSYYYRLLQVTIGLPLGPVPGTHYFFQTRDTL